MSRKKDSQGSKAEIGRRIRQLRGFEMTQQQFGEKLGISLSMVSKLEKGEIPSVELLLKISETFQKSTDWILKGR
jgi:transcriptional regulator with XRE-family HTH domain